MSTTPRFDTEGMLKEHMKQAGTVLDVRIAYNEDQSVKGTALVTYATKDEAETAKRTLNETKCLYDTRPLKVEPSTAEGRDELILSMGNNSKCFESIAA